MTSIDLALVLDEPNHQIVLHTALCPTARRAADNGVPVVTMFDCQAEPAQDDLDVKLVRHDCLDEAPRS